MDTNTNSAVRVTAQGVAFFKALAQEGKKKKVCAILKSDLKALKREPNRKDKDYLGRRHTGKKTVFSCAFTVGVPAFRRALSEETPAEILPHTTL